MQIPNLVIDFLTHGLPLVLSLIAIFYAARLIPRGERWAVLWLTLGAISLIFSKIFRYNVPLSEIQWSVIVGCCYEFDGIKELGGYFSIVLAPIASSLFWLLAVLAILRKRSRGVA